MICIIRRQAKLPSTHWRSMISGRSFTDQHCHRSTHHLCSNQLDMKLASSLTTGTRNMLDQLHRTNHSKYRQYSTVNPMLCCPVVSRTLIRISGKDVTDFLQGLLTNDMRLFEDVQIEGADRISIYSMMLNVQGRVLYDLLLYRLPPEGPVAVYLMECDKLVASELLQTMKRYKIRKKITMADVGNEYKIWSVLPPDGSVDDKPMGLTLDDKEVLHTPDPRLPLFGHRLITRENINVSTVLPVSAVMCDDVTYTRRRYLLGLGEGVLDLPPGNCTPLESNAVFLNGVSFSKGCYVGQELTARTHHTGVIRKRLLPITLKGDSTLLVPGTTIENSKGKNCGKYRNSIHTHGLALLRLTDVIGKGTLIARNKDGQTIVDIETSIPSWWPTDCDEVIKQVLNSS